MKRKGIIIYLVLCIVAELCLAAVYFIPIQFQYDGKTIGSVTDWDKNVQSYHRKVKNSNGRWKKELDFRYSYVMELTYEVDGEEYVIYYEKKKHDCFGSEIEVRYRTADPQDCVVMSVQFIRYCTAAFICAAVCIPLAYLITYLYKKHKASAAHNQSAV